MPLDRQSIEKKDFPIGRRGYDPDAVDAHLARIAEEVEGQSSQPAKAPSLANTAGERIQAIVDAAERTASEIQQNAEDEARKTREDAAADAARTREQATAESREHVAQVMEGTASMRTRIEAMEAELASMLETLKTGTNRVTSDLDLLHGSMTGLGEAGGSGALPSRDAGERDSVAPPVPAAEEDEAVIVEEEVIAVEVEAEPESGADEVEGARLVALNMALNGTPREETQQYLQENFSLADQDALLDEVYATVGES